MEIETLFGLPAHPLVVHGAVVLVPLAAVGLIIVAAIRHGRRWYAPVVLAFSIGALAAVALAQGSGEQLEEKVVETDLVEEHTGMGESVLPWAVAVTVLAGVVAAEPLIRRRRDDLPAAFAIGVMVLSLVAGVGATASVIRVGHSGAKATWDSVGSGEVDGESSPSGDDDGGDDHDDDGDERVDVDQADSD